MVNVSEPNDKFEVVKIVIPINKDKKFGLGVSDINNKVIVSTIDPDSVAAEYLKVNDCIASINGEKVKDKSHCRDLIVNATDEEHNFEFVIERPVEKMIEKPEEKVIEQLKPKEKVTEQTKPNDEIIEIAELDFQPVRPPKDEPKKAVKTEKVAVNVNAFQLSFMEEDEFNFGNPLEGLTFPAPPDVRAILRKRIPEILADYEKVDTITSPPNESLKKTHEIQFEAETHEHAIGFDVPSTKSLSKVKQQKKKQ